MKLEIEPFTLGDVEVKEVDVKTLRFLEFVKAMSGATDTKDQQRNRMVASVTLNGSTRLTKEQIPLIPIPVARRILQVMNDDENNGPKGEVLTPEANGIDSPIIYRLGTPLKMKRGKEDVLIKELEFHATQFGDVEDIISQDNKMSQCVEMLRRIAAPLGVGSLTVLPESLLDQVMPTDGLLLAMKVVENFTE